MSELRLFVAVELPDTVKQALVALQDQLRPGRPPVSWVAPSSMHLTLVFLGDTPAGRLPQIGAAMRAAGGQPLELSLGAAGAFPNLRRPGVLWVGVEGDTAGLARLQSALAAQLEPLGFQRESRPFRPHLTLGRVRRDASPEQQAQLGAALRDLAPPPLGWGVDRSVLFESELRPEGPRYTKRDTVVFAESEQATPYDI